jgi:uncharacterized protein YdaU (DUF1376 family)
MLLLMHYWRAGPLPIDPGQLAAIAKMDPKEFRAVWVVLQPFFTANGDGALHQKRMDWELRRWDDISDKRREAGKRGAEAKHRPHRGNGNVPPTPASKQPGVAVEPMAIATNLPVDNLAIATRLPEPLPDVCQPVSGNCHPFATTFASVHSHPQKSTLTCLLQEKCARESLEAVSEQETAPAAGSVPADQLNAWLDSLPPVPAKAQPRERKHNLEEQKRAVAKPRSMACHLTGEHLALVRKQAGIAVAL